MAVVEVFIHVTAVDASSVTQATESNPLVERLNRQKLVDVGEAVRCVLVVCTLRQGAVSRSSGEPRRF